MRNHPQIRRDFDATPHNLSNIRASWRRPDSSDFARDTRGFATIDFDSRPTQAWSDQLSTDTAALMGSIVMPVALRLSSLMLSRNSSIDLVTNYDVARVASLKVSTPLAN
jgi:hypothetical protein